MTCDVKRCRQKSELTWLGHQVCWKHWERHCSEKDEFSLFKEFKENQVLIGSSPIEKKTEGGEKQCGLSNFE